MFEAVTHFPSGLVAGFCGRVGGVSQGRLESLNFGTKNDDRPEALVENLRLLASAAGFQPSELVSTTQVHGINVMRAREVVAESAADGLWSHCDDTAGRVIAVRTGDCVPVLLSDVAGSYIMALHSGWRGTVANIVASGIQVLRGQGIAPESLLAAIGPCIEQAAFEVGDDVAAQFPRESCWRNPATGKAHVDLPGVVRAQLVAQGLPPSAIMRVGGCTHRHPDKYFSYRRDGKGTGLQYSFIGWTPRSNRA